MRKLFLLFLLTPAAWAVSPQTCTAVKSGNWSDATVWGSCTATGGLSVSYRGSTQTLASGVPGATGKNDRAVIPAPFAVTADVNIELGNPSVETVTALTVQASGSGSFGEVLQTSGHLLYLQSLDSVNQAFNLQQWGVLATVPGSALWLGTAGGGRATVDGRWYIGCSSQATIGCSASAGAWVQATVGTPGTFSAWTGGTGLYSVYNNQTLPVVSVGDLVELLVPPLPAATGTGVLGPPYTATPCATTANAKLGITTKLWCGTPPSAPAPAIMPLTSDSPTCGGAASCTVPHGQPLCVAQVSPLQLGYATYATDGWTCPGTPAPMAITDAGTAPMWLVKPAFVGVPQSYFSWNAAKSASPSAYIDNYDAIRTHYLLPYGYVSNAAGTGPEKKGDTSLAISAVTLITQAGSGSTGHSVTRKDRCDALTTLGDYTFDAMYGEMCLWGGSQSITATIGYTAMAITGSVVQLSNSATGSGTEVLIENSDIRGLVNFSGGSYLWLLSGYNSATANNRLRIEGNNWLATSGVFQLNGVIGSAASPIPFDGNEINNSFALGVPLPLINSGNPASSYVSFSANYLTGPTQIGTNFTTGVPDQPHWSLIGNVGMPVSLFGLSAHSTTFSDALVSRNRFESPNYLGAPFMNIAGTPAHPALVEWNTFYGYRISLTYDSNSEVRYLHLPFSGVHHTIVADSYISRMPAYIPNVTLHHLIQPGWQLPQGSGDSIDFGYQGYIWTDAMKVYNFTGVQLQSGCMSLQDIGDSQVGVVTGAVVADNLCQTALNTAHFFTRGGTAGSSYIGNPQLLAGLNNVMYGTFAAYYGASSAPPPNQNTATLNRFIAANWNGGTNYNTDGTRNLLGVAIQNPTYTTLGSTGTLTYTYTSQSNITLSWNDGGGLGAAKQLNQAGSGVTFTSTALTSGAPYVGSATVTVAGTPWTCGNSGPIDDASKKYYLAGCPVGNFVRFTSAAGAGKAYAIMGDSNNTLFLTPDPTADGVASGDAFVIYVVNLTLPNSGATNSVEVGVDPRVIPASTLSDTGISLSASGICATGCAANNDPAIPMSYTWDVSDSPLNGSINSPMAGPDPTVQAFAPGGTYTPTGTAWKTEGSIGGPVGAMSGITSTLTGPTGSYPYVFTYALTGGTFSGGTPLTCSDAGSGLFFLGTAFGAGSATFSPAAGVSSQAFSYAPATAGSHTITCATTLGSWADPTPVTFTSVAPATLLIGKK